LRPIGPLLLRLATIAIIAMGCAMSSCAVEEPCVVGPDDCPNACTEGIVLEGGTCGGPADCGCGFFCKAGACTYYMGANLSCLCDGVAMTPPGRPVLGVGSHVPDDLLIEVVADASDELATPRDLAFNPDNPDQLWVLNFATESVTVLSNATTDSPSSKNYHEMGSGHFLSHPSAFAFGAPGEMASIHETHEKTVGTFDGAPDEFMGPALHSTDLTIFKAGWSCHLDMLHDSPLGMGIAWGGISSQDGNVTLLQPVNARVYWVFDGYHRSITRYDFGGDHGLGGEDHADGIIRRYAEGQVKRVEGVPSHMVMDPSTGLLYIADTGHERIAVLDTSTGTVGAEIFPGFDQATRNIMNNTKLETLIDQTTVPFEKPSGIALYDGLLWVTDNATSRIYAITLEGDVIDWLDTGLPAGSLMGITFDTEGRLYIVDAVGDQVLRISAP
jgi:hypothetical protein